MSFCRIDGRRCKRHVGISVCTNSNVPTFIPSKLLAIGGHRGIATDVISQKLQENRHFLGRIWMPTDVRMVTPTGIEPVFQP
jgi:hypothetical protein